jgi:hypothetical protein
MIHSIWDSEDAMPMPGDLPGKVPAADNLPGGSDKLNVAVCFAGFARSFVYPAVHESIKYNVIDALAEGANVHTFFRISSQESSAVDHDSQKLATGSFSKQAEIDTAFTVLQPTKTQYFTIDSEKTEMDALFGHKVS